MALTQETAIDWQRLRWNRINNNRHNFRQFCLDYFPQYFYAEPSLMHQELFEELPEIIDNNRKDLFALAAPRGNAKSTLVSFALPIWCAVYKKKHYILIISDTASQADDFLGSIKTEMEENLLLINDFGSQVGIIWTQSDIITSQDVRIQSLGAGKKVRGRKYKQYRPDLILVDDLENDESVRSPEQRVKNAEWNNKALAKAGDERTDIIHAGTILHYDSLLSNLLKNPIYQSHKYQSIMQWSESPLWEQWEKIITDLTDLQRVKHAKEFFEQNKQEMLAGTKVLWEQKEDYYNLMIQRIADGPAAFSSEKQNEPLSDEDRRFQEQWIQYFDDSDLAGKKLYIVAAIDPSLGKQKQSSDYSAIIVLGADELGIVYVLAADMAKRHPDIIITDALQWWQSYPYAILGVESVQFQEYFKDNVNKELAKEEYKDYGIIVKGLKTHSDKVLRIESLQPDVKNGRIKFRRNQKTLIDQLINFPSAAHDDGPDALELAMGILGKRSAVADFYKELAHESQKLTAYSFIRNPQLARLGRVNI